MQHALRPLIVSAPFGNYVQPSYATPVLGTFTRARRAGWLRRWWRVLSTVRYYPALRAWKNKLGLPNPGIDWLLDQVRRGRVDMHNKVVSITARSTEDWRHLLGVLEACRAPWVELNVSCPNTPGEPDASHLPDVFREAAAAFPGTDPRGENRPRVIVKLPPVGWRPVFRDAVAYGLRAFHACNTMPTPAGGLSGKPLKPFSLDVCRQVREAGVREYGAWLTVIGGGGVTAVEDVDDYLEARVDHVAVGSLLLWPFQGGRLQRLAYRAAVGLCSTPEEWRARQARAGAACGARL